ncbi:hypothetical protein APA_4349 [Pseudanabaena sp. lw0831]|nr:hypothetical protein APA_4349 [Pseudanabaena sp. lw0831]
MNDEIDTYKKFQKKFVKPVDLMNISSTKYVERGFKLG